jgi:CDP-glucose 4,6-dehydratase
VEDLALSRALVTGGHGLLGTWLTRALVDAGAGVVTIQRDDRAASVWATAELDGRVDVVHGDICTDGLVARALNEYEIDSVFHLAAQTQVGAANRAPASTFESNIRGTWMLLEAARLNGARRVIVASSDKAYGPQHELPYHEDQPLRPLYPYDVSKAACDLLARSYWHTFGLPVAVTRCANLYGGGDPNGSRLIPEAVCAALAGSAPIMRSDGSPQRDFLYVEDAVAAYLALWRALGRGVGMGEAFNAGGGMPWRVGEVVAIVCRLCGCAVSPDVRGTGVPAGEIDRQWVDSGKLTALTGWRPAYPLEEGLRRTIEWYRAHPESRVR